MTDFLVKRFIKNSTDVNDPAVRTAYGNLAGAVGIFCNVLLCAAKLAVGTLFGSISITADAVNNLSDASSSVITLVGFRLSAKPADDEHPYGHARIEYLAGLAVSVMILVIGVELARSSIGKILSPTAVEFSLVTVAVLLLSIGVKLWMAAFNKKVGRRIGSAALEATAMDSRNDVISTAAVLAASVVSGLTGLELDGWMGLGVALFILWSGVGILKETVDPLLGEAPSEELTDYIGKKVMSYDGVLGTHDLMVHDYGPGRRFASVHVEMAAENDVMQSHDIIDNIERDFQENDHHPLRPHPDGRRRGGHGPGVGEGAGAEHFAGAFHPRFPHGAGAVPHKFDFRHRGAAQFSAFGRRAAQTHPEPCGDARRGRNEILRRGHHRPQLRGHPRRVQNRRKGMSRPPFGAAKGYGKGRERTWNSKSRIRCAI